MNIRGNDNYRKPVFAANHTNDHTQKCPHYSSVDKQLPKQQESEENLEGVDNARNNTFTKLFKLLDDKQYNNDNGSENIFTADNLFPDNYINSSKMIKNQAKITNHKIKQRNFEKINKNIQWLDALVAIYGKDILK